MATDESWQVARGPITFSNVYGGEDYDARLETKGWDRDRVFDDGLGLPAVPAPGIGELRGASDSSPPFRTYRKSLNP